MSTLPAREQLLAVACLVRSDSLEEMRFRYEAYRALCKKVPAQEWVEQWTLLGATEDMAGFRSDEEIMDTLRDMNILLSNGDMYALKDYFTLEELLGLPEAPGSIRIGRNFMTTFDGNDHQSPQAGLLSIMHALRLARANVFPMLQKSIDRGLSTPTTFWKWEDGPDDATLEPWGNRPSTYTLIDIHKILMAVTDQLDDGNAEGKDYIGGAAACLNHLLDLADRAQAPWQGLLYIDDDDDYPGSNCATVPSNAALLEALAKFFVHSRGLVCPDRSRRAMTNLCNFLLWQQTKKGGWGVYTPQGGTVDEIPTFTTAAMRALAACLEVDDPPGGDEPIRKALQKAISFLVAIHYREGSRAGWRKSFSAHGRLDVYETVDIAATLAETAPLCGAADDAKAIACEAARWAAEAWTVHPVPKDNIQTVLFQAPMLGATAPARTTWEQPGHARAMEAFLVLAAHGFVDLKGGVLPGKLDQAAAVIASACKNGCWYDFNLEDCVFPSNMVFFIFALVRYARSACGPQRKSAPL